MDRERAKNNSYIIVIAIMIFIGGCEHQAPKSASQGDVDPVTNESSPAARTGNQWAGELPSNEDRSPERSNHTPQRQHIVEIGKRPLPEATPDKRIRTQTNTEGDITLNFQETDIREFVKAVLGEVLGFNFVIDPQVTGKITLQTTDPIRKREVLPLAEEILSMHGATLVQSGDLYKILPRDAALRGNVAPGQTATTDGYQVRIVPLDYIAAMEMQKILEPFTSEGSSLRVDTNRNLLILSGTATELNALQETIDLFDVDWLRGMSVGLYPLDYVSPKDLKAELESILTAMQSNKGDAPLHGLVRIVPLERLSSILLIGATSAALREAELWLYRLDKPGETVGRQLYVYRLKNAKATDIADVLSGVLGSTQRDTIQQSGALKPGLEPVEITSPTDIEDMPTRSQDPPPPGKQASEEGITLPNGDAIQIIADDTRNALVVLATPHEYQMVEKAVKRLDIVPLQVIIEASILEVTLSDDLTYGVEWFFKNSVDTKKGIGTLDLGAAGIGALAPAFSYTVIDSVGDVRFVLNALAEKTNLNVLSSPSLMVLDNQTAHINVGDEIPVPSRQSISNIDPSAPTVNEIQFRKTGVTLDVTPRVNHGGLVTLEIKQEVSNAVATTTSSLDAPTIQQRAIESTVAVHNGDTIVLGGLIRDSQFRDNRGVPVLQSIPMIGKLFGSTGSEYARTELLVLLTPRVVGNRTDAREITEEFKQKMHGLEPIYEK